MRPERLVGTIAGIQVAHEILGRRLIEAQKETNIDKYQFTESVTGRGKNRHFNIRELLANPIKFKDELLPFSGNDHLDYLEKRIQQNISENHNLTERQKEIITYEIRAFIYALDEEKQKKFTEIVKAFEEDKNYLKGIIFSGGETRVVTETAGAMLINTICTLLGVQLKSFSGTSAGAFLASGFAFGGLNSAFFKVTTEKDYGDFFNNPEELKRWSNELMRNAYKFRTGKDVDIVLGKHLKEMGSDLEVLVGQMGKTNLTMPETYLLPRELEKRLGIKFDDLPVCEIILATCNSHVISSPSDLLKNNTACFIRDKEGEKVFFFDPGVCENHLLPLHLLEEEVENYHRGKIPLPGFFFVIGNKRTEDLELPETIAGEKTTWLKSFLHKVFVHTTDIITTVTGNETKEVLRRIGALRTYLEAQCELEVNEGNKTKILKLRAFDLNKPMAERQELIIANIGLMIDDLHTNMVNSTLSPYELYLNDIHYALGMWHKLGQERNLWEVRLLEKMHGKNGNGKSHLTPENPPEQKVRTIDDLQKLAVTLLQKSQI